MLLDGVQGGNQKCATEMGEEEGRVHLLFSWLPTRVCTFLDDQDTLSSELFIDVLFGNGETGDLQMGTNFPNHLYHNQACHRTAATNPYSIPCPHL